LEEQPPAAASLDQAAVLEAARDIATRLIAPIAPGADVDVEVSQGRVTVHIDSSDDLGLLIGREGQTLSSLQYLASRMLARRLGSLVHVQMDAGDYRGRQDDKLRELALLLAERAKTTGRVCPTRPLSSYHRRIVHMALQGDPAVQTRSSGEGPLKRVIIQPARPEQ
jgi:spoIIIJ-associated protein